MRQLLLLSSSLLALAACSPADDGPVAALDGAAPASDASVADNATGDVISSERTPEAEAAAPCNDLVLDAPAVGLIYDPAAPPVPAGGTIADGTYWMTEQRFYETASGPTLPLGRIKVMIAGTTWQEVTGDPEPGSINPDRYFTYELGQTGTSITLTRKCPSVGQPESPAYTAEATRFTMFARDRGKTIGTLLTKQ